MRALPAATPQIRTVRRVGARTETSTHEKEDIITFPSKIVVDWFDPSMFDLSLLVRQKKVLLFLLPEIGFEFFVSAEGTRQKQSLPIRSIHTGRCSLLIGTSSASSEWNIACQISVL